MKTERRHELQENELANWLGDLIRKIQPYGRVIIGVLVLAVTLIAATSYVGSRNLQADQAAWTEYYDAAATGDPEQLVEVATNFPGTVAAGWALQSAADLSLSQAVEQSFRDRKLAKENLDAAKQTYKSVIDAYANEDMLLQRATFGLGKTLETAGDFDGAKQQYQKVVDKWPDSEISGLAQERLAKVESPETQAWYAWFEAQEPPSSSLNDASLFQNLPNTPAEPDFDFPNPGQLLGPDDTGASDTGASDTTEATESKLDLDLGLEPADDASSDQGDLPLGLPVNESDGSTEGNNSTEGNETTDQPGPGTSKVEENRLDLPELDSPSDTDE